MKTIELTPVNGRKSFYGKCKVEIFGNLKSLISYGTKVASYDGSSLWISNDPSHLTNTTLTHINAFLVYCGFNTMTKQEILKHEN